MTKQEKIREGMEQILGILYNFHLDGDAYVDKLLKYLHSQGVVIKVDDELDLEEEFVMARVWSDIFDGSLTMRQYYEEQERYLTFIKPIQEEIKEAGLVATEPLIEEK